MASAMMAFLRPASPALLASDTASPKGLKQGSGVNSTTWCTLVTSKPCSKYHFSKGVANKIFFSFHTPNQTAWRLSHDVMLFCVAFHEVSNISVADFGVLEDGAHFTELLFEMIWYMNIHFHTPKQTLMSHLTQYSLQAHNLDCILGSADFRGDKTL